MTPPPRPWLLTLILLGAMSSVFSSCTVPLVGFAALASTTLSRRQGVVCLSVIWLVNQALGFSVRNYPLEANTVAWGVMMLAASLAALALGRLIDRRGRRPSTPGIVSLGPRVAVSLTVGFLVYELILWLASFSLGSTGGFTLAVLGSVLRTNGLWALGLSGLFCQFDRITRRWGPRLPSIPSSLP